MTNKTDDMPEGMSFPDFIRPDQINVWESTVDDGIVRNIWGNAKYKIEEGGGVYGVTKYTRAVEITDERVKEAYDSISEPNHFGGELSRNDIETIRQVLSDYAQMVECIRDLTGTDDFEDDYEHAAIIKKCRGKNG